MLVCVEPALVGLRGRWGEHRGEPFGLLVDEGAGPGGARPVHGEVLQTPAFPLPGQREERRDVLERLKIFTPGGGFVFNTIHNIQADTPTENVLAMFEAVREFNGVATHA